jgi:hypothetical protein
MQRIKDFLNRQSPIQSGISIGFVFGTIGRTLKYFRWEQRENNWLDFYKFFMGYNNPTYFEDAILCIQIYLGIQTYFIIKDSLFPRHNQTNVILHQILRELKQKNNSEQILPQILDSFTDNK